MTRAEISVVLLLASGLAAAYTGYGNDGGGSWQYRVKVTVPATAVDANLTGFPVHLALGDLPAGFHANVATDGCDIRILEADTTTETPFEIVNYNDATDVGELYFLADSLSSSADNEFYVYYGNPSATCYAATDPFGSQAVWADYDIVLHDAGTADATGNTTPTVLGSPTIGAASGIAGSATQFNNGAIDQGLNLGDPAIQTNGFLISYFQKYDDLSGTGFQYTMQHGIGSEGFDYIRPYEAELSSSSYPRLRILIRDDTDSFGDVASAFETNRTPSTSGWEHYAIYGVPGGDSVGYLNGSPLGPAIPIAADFDPLSDMYFAYGFRYDDGVESGVTTDREFVGVLDEIRVKSSEPTNRDAWVAFEENNVGAPAATYSLGAEEQDGGPSPPSRRIMTISSKWSSGPSAEDVNADGFFDAFQPLD